MNIKTLLSDKRVIVLVILVVVFILILKKAKAMSTAKKLSSVKKMPQEWQVSPNGYEHIKKWEGVRYKAYKDSAGLWTTGIGHLIKSNEQYLITATLTEYDVQQLFYNDIKRTQRIVNTKIKVPITQGLYDALISLAYNTGTIYNYIVDLVNKGDYQALAARWLTTAITVNNGTKVVQGLKNRRASEVKLFT